MSTHTAERLRRLGAAARASQAVADDDREARDAAIEAADLAGLSVREIAQLADVSPSRVQTIIVVRTAARQAAHAHAVGLL